MACERHDGDEGERTNSAQTHHLIICEAERENRRTRRRAPPRARAPAGARPRRPAGGGRRWHAPFFSGCPVQPWHRPLDRHAKTARVTGREHGQRLDARLEREGDHVERTVIVEWRSDDQILLRHVSTDDTSSATTSVSSTRIIASAAAAPGSSASPPRPPTSTRAARSMRRTPITRQFSRTVFFKVVWCQRACFA